MSGMQPEEARLLDEAMAVVKQQTRSMLKCLETPGKLMDALKCSSTLVSELRTSSLGPKQYYELYMAVFDALRDLSVFLRESHPVNHLADLYELVQYAGNIVPRLYLMITVGTVYMSIEDAPVKEIMKDMMEMSRGVQHPIRGLFLRFYLSGQARDHLPTGLGDGPEGNLQDSISFVLTNFVEMNKLWVRLQHQGHSREREKRIQERQELQQLVGSNLVRLSQLVDLNSYKNVILQPLLEQVVQCRDKLAQEYLLEVITQVFPDEFHLHTLDEFLSATARLNPDVNIKAIVIGLMNRLASYATQDATAESPEVKQEKELAAASKLLETLNLQKETTQAPASTITATTTETETETAAPSKSDVSEGGEDVPVEANGTQPITNEPVNTKDEGYSESIAETSEKSILSTIKLYEIFYDQVLNLINAQRLPIQDVTALLVSLTNLALNIYPDRLEYVNQILGFTYDKVKELANSTDLHSPITQKNILELMLAPVKSYSSIFTVLVLPNYLPLLQAQSYSTRRAIASSVIRSIISTPIIIDTPEHVEGVLELVKVLIREGPQQQAAYPTTQQARRAKDTETEETIEEQGLLARLVHLLQSDDNDVQFKLIQATKTAYSAGGDRIKFTTPALITSCVKLARRYKSREHYDDGWQAKAQSLYKFMHQTLSTLYSRVGAADLCLRLFILCGQIADQGEFEEVAYEFFAQAFTIYEEAISDSRAQFQAVCVIASALQSTRNFTKENYDTLITKCALHGSKLLKKHDQCRAVYLASHLWWAVEIPARNEEDGKLLYRDGKRVLECLQRALRVADACMDASVSVELFVEILNRYVYYFDHQNEAVTVKYINGLIELIHSNLGNSPDAASQESPRSHFERTLAYIASRDYEGVVTEAKN